MSDPIGRQMRGTGSSYPVSLLIDADTIHDDRTPTNKGCTLACVGMSMSQTAATASTLYISECCETVRTASSMSGRVRVHTACSALMPSSCPLNRNVHIY